MEHELDSQAPKFEQELTTLLATASIVKVYGWSRAKDQSVVIELIKKHGYAVVVYSFFNFAKLHPKSNSGAKPSEAPLMSAKP